MDDIQKLYTEFLYFPELEEPQYEVCYYSMMGRGERVNYPIPALPPFALEMSVRAKEELERGQEMERRQYKNRELKGDNPEEQFSSDTSDSLRGDEDTDSSDVQVTKAIIAAQGLSRLPSGRTSVVGRGRGRARGISLRSADIPLQQPGGLNQVDWSQDRAVLPQAKPHLTQKKPLSTSNQTLSTGCFRVGLGEGDGMQRAASEPCVINNDTEFPPLVRSSQAKRPKLPRVAAPLVSHQRRPGRQKRHLNSRYRPRNTDPGVYDSEDQFTSENSGPEYVSETDDRVDSTSLESSVTSISSDLKGVQSSYDAPDLHESQCSLAPHSRAADECPQAVQDAGLVRPHWARDTGDTSSFVYVSDNDSMCASDFDDIIQVNSFEMTAELSTEPSISPQTLDYKEKSSLFSESSIRTIQFHLNAAQSSRERGHTRQTRSESTKADCQHGKDETMRNNSGHTEACPEHEVVTSLGSDQPLSSAWHLNRVDSHQISAHSTSGLCQPVSTSNQLHSRSKPSCQGNLKVTCLHESSACEIQSEVTTKLQVSSEYSDVEPEGSMKYVVREASSESGVCDGNVKFKRSRENEGSSEHVRSEGFIKHVRGEVSHVHVGSEGSCENMGCEVSIEHVQNEGSTEYLRGGGSSVHVRSEESSKTVRGEGPNEHLRGERSREHVRSEGFTEHFGGEGSSQNEANERPKGHLRKEESSEYVRNEGSSKHVANKGNIENLTCELSSKHVTSEDKHAMTKGSVKLFRSAGFAEQVRDDCSSDYLIGEGPSHFIGEVSREHAVGKESSHLTDEVSREHAVCEGCSHLTEEVSREHAVCERCNKLTDEVFLEHALCEGCSHLTSEISREHVECERSIECLKSEGTSERRKIGSFEDSLCYIKNVCKESSKPSPDIDGYNEGIVAQSNIATGSHDNIVVVAHDNSETVAHDSSGTVAHDSSETVAHDSSETVTHDISETVAHDNSETVVHGSSETIVTHGSSETVAHGSSKTVAHNNSETVTHDSSEPVAHDSRETVVHGNSETGVHVSSETVVHGNSETGVHVSSETVTHDSSEPVVHDSSETVVHGNSETGVHVSSEIVTHDSSEPVAHDSSETGVHGNSETVAHDSSETGVHGNSETGVHVSSETVTHDSSEPVVHDSRETVVHGNSETVAHVSSETVTHVSSDTIVTHGNSDTIITHDNSETVDARSISLVEKSSKEASSGMSVFALSEAATGISQVKIHESSGLTEDELLEEAVGMSLTRINEGSGLTEDELLEEAVGMSLTRINEGSGLTEDDLTEAAVGVSQVRITEGSGLTEDELLEAAVGVSQVRITEGSGLTEDDLTEAAVGVSQVRITEGIGLTEDELLEAAVGVSQVRITEGISLTEDELLEAAVRMSQVRITEGSGLTEDELLEAAVGVDLRHKGMCQTVADLACYTPGTSGGGIPLTQGQSTNPDPCVSEINWSLMDGHLIQLEGLPINADLQVLEDLVASYGRILKREVLPVKGHLLVRYRLESEEACDFAVECLHDSDCVYPEATSVLICTRV